MSMNTTCHCTKWTTLICLFDSLLCSIRQFVVGRIVQSLSECLPGASQGADVGSQVTHSANSPGSGQPCRKTSSPSRTSAPVGGRATRMVATTSKVSTSIPKPIDIAVTMLLLVYLLFIGTSLSLSIYFSKEIILTCSLVGLLTLRLRGRLRDALPMRNHLKMSS